MAFLSRFQFHKIILISILLSFCFLPVHFTTDETINSAETAKYVTAHSSSAQLANYRQQSSIKFLEHSIYLSRFLSIPKLLLFAFPLIIVTFLFVIQIRLKWQKLMPIKYVSRFVISPSQETNFIPERGLIEDEIHTRGNQHDSQNSEGTEDFLRMYSVCLGRAVYCSIFFG